jgi:peptidoglycan hydrolase CwlO-like protein
MGKFFSCLARTQKIKFTFFLLVLFLLALKVPIARAQCDISCLNSKISEYEAQIRSLQAQSNTLSNQIAQFNAQISLTQLKINQTEEKIALLGGRIDQLSISLANLNRAFTSRVVETYKIARFSSSLNLVLTAGDFGDIFSRFHYLRKIQDADQGLLVRLTQAQNTYKEEKTDQEKLQEELEGQQKVLGAQKTAKAQLLSVTQSDEKKYQQLLAKALAEREAIQSIIAGLGQETNAGSVGEGARIASIIPGASACSSGGHLHFEVVRDSSHQNPADLLSSKSVEWDNGPDAPFSFNGSWPWPLNDPIRITQGYGMTYYAATLRYYGGAPHTGLDMVNIGDYTVKAVKPGTLFRGAIGCGGGTLRYVKVQQDDGYNTYYLHVNY